MDVEIQEQQDLVTVVAMQNVCSPPSPSVPCLKILMTKKIMHGLLT